MAQKVSERAIVAVVGAVQFVNILDFMMVMPLGPDFSRSLGIPVSHLGYIGGSYTAAASVSGVVCAFFLDRFDRKTALVLTMVGLILGTALGGLAQGMPSLIAARVVAGVFGGPATSLSYAIIADVVPAERRGKAMGAVMGAFSIASVFGVPLGLELSQRGSWRTPFFGVALVGLVVTVVAIVVLPKMREHVDRATTQPAPSIGELARADVLVSLMMTATTMFGMFILVPNISTYVTANLHYPRARLGLLYLVGGVFSFGMMRVAGWMVDHFGAARVGTFGTVMMALVIWCGFGSVPPWTSVMASFIGLMTSSAFRNVSYNTLTTRVPRASERARFGSVQSAVQHLSAALGAFLSSQMLTETPAHELVGMQRTAHVSMAVSIVLVPLLYIVEGRVKAIRS